MEAYSHSAGEELQICIGISSGLTALGLVYESIGRPFPEEARAKKILMTLKNRALRDKTSYLPPKVESILTAARYLST